MGKVWHNELQWQRPNNWLKNLIRGISGMSTWFSCFVFPDMQSQSFHFFPIEQQSTTWSSAICLRCRGHFLSGSACTHSSIFKHAFLCCPSSTVRSWTVMLILWDICPQQARRTCFKYNKCIMTIDAPVSPYPHNSNGFDAGSWLVLSEQ